LLSGSVKARAQAAVHQERLRAALRRGVQPACVAAGLAFAGSRYRLTFRRFVKAQVLEARILPSSARASGAGTASALPHRGAARA
jgi:hypothetical protein